MVKRVILLVILISGCVVREEVNVLYAGSLVNSVEELGFEFEKSFKIQYRGEGHGSVTASRLIHEDLKKPDVFLSADYNLMEGISDWYVVFLSTEVVLCYNPKGKFSQDFERVRNGDIEWFEVLLQENLKLGRTDPDLDPKGYRTIFVILLAEKYYGVSDLSERILKGYKNPLQIFRETEMMARLETGQIDAAFAYKNEAYERNLPFIELPDEINLSNPEFEDFYASVSYKNHRGGTILFAATIPKSSKNHDIGLKFLIFLLENRRIFETHGFKLVKLVFGGDEKTVPKELKNYVGEGYYGEV